MGGIAFSEIIEFYPKHNASVYEELKKDCQGGRLIPFVGAGLSVFCGYQGWPDVLKQLAAYIYKDSIRKEVEARIEAGELLQAAQDIQNNYPLIFKELQKRIDYDKIKNCDVERLYASAVYTLPYLFSGGLMMTTNFDRVLEEVCERCHQKFGNIITPYDPDLLTQARQGNPHCLFKLHGDIGPEVHDINRLVFTQAQYDRAYADDSPIMQELPQWFQSKKLLFLGCSLAMDRTMEVLQAATKRNPGLEHYAILACEPDDIPQRCIEMGKLGISALFYPDGRYEAVRILLERLLEDTNPAAYKELSRYAVSAVRPGETRRFMYDAGYIAFVGREEELARLEEFCQQSGPVSWWAVSGPGGMGKSRLVYEFTNRQRTAGWTVFWLRHNDYSDLAHWIPPAGRCIVVADDVQAHLQALGNWLVSIAEQPRSEKLRILLLERDGKSLDSARWVDLLQADSPYDDTLSSLCYRPDFLELTSLSDGELKAIMMDFAQASGKPLTDAGHADRLLQTLKRIDEGFQRPVYALAIVDAWCGGKDPARWNKEQVLDALTKRELKFYYDRLRSLSADKISKEMRSELEALLARSCLVPFLPLGEITEEAYPKLCRRAEQLDLTLLELLRQIGAVHEIEVHIRREGPERPSERKVTLEAVILDCPDLMKEYLVLWHVFRKRKLELLLPQNWDNNPVQLVFLWRVLHDYPDKLEEQRPFLESFFAGDPKSEILAQIYGKMLFDATVKLQKAGNQALSRLEKLHEQLLTSEEIAFAYAKGLVNLSAKQGVGSYVDSVGKVRVLHEQFPASEEIAFAYAEGLVNLSAKQGVGSCVDSIGKTRHLHEQFPASEEIAAAYAKGLVNLSAKQELESCVDSVGKVRVLHERFLTSEEIAVVYAKGLVNLSIEEAFEYRIDSVDKLRLLHEQFPASEGVALEYAKGLVNLSFKQTLEWCTRSVDKLRLLHEEFPESEGITEVCAGSFVNLSLSQTGEADIQKSVKQTKDLLVQYPQNTDIQLAYAQTQFNLTLKQAPENLIQTVTQLRKFLSAHSGANQAFQTALDTYLGEHPEHTERYSSLRF